LFYGWIFYKFTEIGSGQLFEEWIMSPEKCWMHAWGMGILGCLVLSMIGVSCADKTDQFKQVKRMGRGVNIIGYDPIWKDFSKARFKEKHFKLIHDGGFQTVRVNLFAFAHMDTANGNRLSDGFLSTLDWSVKNATANGLMVILDLHNFTDFAQDPVRYKPRFLDFWKQIVQRFKDAPDNVVFEILNEPNGKLTPELWNQYLKEALAVIRETNPTRTVIVGSPFWNTIDNLNLLDIPKDDRNIVVTVHYYEPLRFTHQGAPWAGDLVKLSGITWGSDEDKKRVETNFAKAQAWSKANDRPILLGEFGAYDKGDIESRVRYTSFVARTAESLGWAWTYWQFDSDFVVYDIDKDQWNEPIHKALIP
jgi:endoglucanase